MEKNDHNIAAIREEISRVDATILGLVAKRMRLAEEIGHLKQEDGLPIRDLAVEAKVRGKTIARGIGYGLEPTRVRELMDVLIAWAIDRQNREEDRKQP